MAVSLKFISLVIPIKKINECYPGGFDQYKKDNIKDFEFKAQHDDKLFRDSAMNPMDMKSLVNYWEDMGLISTIQKENKTVFKDLCIIEMGRTTRKCDWIECTFSSASLRKINNG